MKRQILVSWLEPCSFVVLRFYGGLKFQPALSALFQQADCQPAFVRDALGLRTTRILDSMNVLFRQWYLAG